MEVKIVRFRVDLPQEFSGQGGQPTKLSKGSLTCYGKGRTADIHAREHKLLKQIVSAELDRRFPNLKRIDGPVRVGIVIWCVRLKSHYNSKGLKANAPVYQIAYPDIDKAARAILDTMSKRVFKDDCTVSTLVAKKRYTERCVNWISVCVEKEIEEEIK